MSEYESEQPRKPFRVTKHRVGRIRFIRPDGAFGFIQGEDFREDVFFHQSVWESDQNVVPEEDMVVEFEIDEEHLASENRLRAIAVRPTTRPEGRRMSGRDAPHLMVKHHPKARRKRPSWRSSS